MDSCGWMSWEVCISADLLSRDAGIDPPDWLFRLTRSLVIGCPGATPADDCSLALARSPFSLQGRTLPSLGLSQPPPLSSTIRPAI